MKLKSLPEDFQVEELSDFLPDGGPYAAYRLTKRGLGTPEVVAAIARRWKIDRRHISVGGLKDRHAVTTQWITIYHGPQRNLEQTNFRLAYQGQASRPFASQDIGANRFVITLRDLSAAEVRRAEQALPRLAEEGLPNYFDQQRFGSVGESGEFVARAWCVGEWERAIWLAVADPNPHDRPRHRAERRLLAQHWGQWDWLGKRLRSSPAREVAAYLAHHPGDFRGAHKVLPAELRRLCAATYQSYLWNRLLARWLRDHFGPEQLADVAVGRWTLPFPRQIDPEERPRLASLVVPLPSGRDTLQDCEFRPLVEKVLAGEGLNLAQLRLRWPRRTFFSKGGRKAWVFPRGLEIQSREDELALGRWAVVLRFELPRGAYATVVTKGLKVAMHEPPSPQGWPP